MLSVRAIDPGRPSRRKRRFAVALGCAAQLLTLAVLVLGGLMLGANPKTSGLITLEAGSSSPGGWVLGAPVRIERDRHGVPTIRASSLADAAFGLGMAHAQDRLWQMETHRRIGAGRLAEALGPAALDNDRFLRALGVRWAAQAQWARLDPQSRAVLEAYSSGVNETIARTRVLPPEFLILGLAPEPWTPVDSLSWTLMMAWDLGGNWTTELMRMRLSSVLDVDRINEVLPPAPGSTHPQTRDYANLYRDLGLAPRGQAGGLADAGWQALADSAPTSGIEGTGSNNWVLAGHRTSTGSPLLANDPHLGLTTPALWYFARILVPELEIAGATLPGVPLVVLGQTRDIAWGFTNTGPDVQDLYIEALDQGQPGRYRTPGGSAAFTIREETIRVKGGPDVRLRVRHTRHGPVISDAGTLKGLNLGDHVLALRWTALDDDLDLVAAGLAMARSRSVPEFVEASRLWTAPMQNMVVADRAGRIGMVAAGRVPRRRSDNDLMGMAPAPGWDARYDWVGWIAPDRTPRVFDPPRGWIATANQRIHDSDYPHFLGSDWALPYRQARIEQILESRSRHSQADLVALQQDEVSLAARELLPWLRMAQGRHRLAPQSERLLDRFDGTMDGQQAAPLLAWSWQRALAHRLLSPRLGAERFERFSHRSFHDALLGILRRQDAWWCDDPRTPAVESCQEQINLALDDALEELQQRLGPDIGTWRWDALHRMVAEHRPFSKVPALGSLFALSLPVGGDTYTVHALRVGLGGPAEQRYRATHGPSLKAVYDLGDRARSRFIHSSGQSGLPWRAGYRHWLQDWSVGAGVEVWPDPAQADSMDVLTIMPAGQQPEQNGKR